MRPFLLLALLFGAAFAVAEPVADPLQASQAQTAQMSTIESDEPTAKKKRLRFKTRGPTCMCVDGLSEDDIQKQQIQSSEQIRKEK